MKKLFVVLIAVLMLFSLCGCGGSNDDASSGQTKITFFAGIDTDTGNFYEELVKTYNEGQGKVDGVYVDYKPKASNYDADLSTVFAGTSVPDVITLSDQYFKGYAKKEFLYNIDSLVASSGLDLSKMPTKNVNRFRINLETKSAGGDNDPLYAVPNGSNPTFLYYNVDAFENADINIISISENELDSYNSSNGTSYMPHGYAEYAEDPGNGLKASKNLNGKTVYKVFNNQIPMNWNELDNISKYMTVSYNPSSKTTYGFLSEWWFSHGWSVGGDCMNWDNEANQYVFTLGNLYTNYLVTKDVIVNGTSYKAGDILSYVDKKYLAENEDQVTDELYALPSQYEAFAEFCALSQVKGKTVDYAGKEGYGISPSPAALGSYTNAHFFTAESVAIVEEAIVNLNTVAKSTEGRFTFDVAPLYQYREYEGGDINADGTLKVIGENGYTGELKYVNDTKIVGKMAGADLNDCFAVPAKAANPEAAVKFIAWAASSEGQKILAKSNAQTPNFTQDGLTDEFLNAPERLCKNYRVVIEAQDYEDIGDWSYVEDGQWVNYWSTILNSDVRNGDMPLDKFFANEQVTEYANINLQKYNIHIQGK